MRKGRCKHFTGTMNKTCHAGVCYDDVTLDPHKPGSLLRLPCIQIDVRGNPKPTENRGTCAKYEEPTAEEVAAHEAAINAEVDRLSKAGPLIKKVKAEHKGQSWKGTDVCPVCGKTIHLTHAAYNGHVWGKCETDGCLSWME